MSFYRQILKQSWQLTWRYKYLWLFGVFAALLGNGGELEIIFNNIGADPGQALFPSWQRIASTGVFSWHTLANIGGLFRHDTLNIIFISTITLALLVLGVFLIWLVVVSQVAIVNNTAALTKQKKVNFRDGLDSGLLNFWPVFILNILIKSAIYILLVLVSLPVVFLKGSFGANLFYIIALVLMVPVVIILSFIMKYAIAYVVIGRYKVLAAIKQGWQLFKNNWLISFEMAVILFLINFGVGLAIILAILTLAVPFLFLGFIFYYSFSLVGSWLIAFLAFVTFFLLIIGIGAALAVFQISSWTGLFLELDKKSGISKLVRVVNDLVKA